MFQTLTVLTGQHTELLDLTDQIQAAVRESGVKEGLCYLFVPHTTAALDHQRKRRSQRSRPTS